MTHEYSVDELLDLVGDAEPVDPRLPPHPGRLIATEQELADARLAPRCIVYQHTYADVAQVVAPGGTGKTTLLLYEAIHIALGRPVWGLPVESTGWTLFVTAEDRREQLLARLREILASMELTPAERSMAIAGVRIWDVTGEHVKLVAVVDGNIIVTALADRIVKAYQDDRPAVVIFDPLVSFGASEQHTNDNEQGIVTAARRIVKGLDCCVRVVHHTGKGNAREGTLDQYSGRGGSAMPDGSRMTTVLQAWNPEAIGAKTPPLGCHPGPDVSITLLARAKLSYAPPNRPLIWVRRDGYRFEHFLEAVAADPAAKRVQDADQVARFLMAEYDLGRTYSLRDLHTVRDTLGLSRDAITSAISELRVSGRLVDAPLPKDQCWGRKQTYLGIRQ